MTNTIRLKITCFLLLFTVLLIKGILDLAWHLATRMKFGTLEQIWDLYGTISGLWSQLGPSPKFGTSIVSTAYGAYLDHAYAQNLAKPPFTRICREFEN